MSQKENKLILYKDDEGKLSVNTLFADEDVWLTQAQLVEVYQSSKSNISEHLTNIFNDNELDKEVVVRKFRTTAAELLYDRVDNEKPSKRCWITKTTKKKRLTSGLSGLEDEITKQQESIGLKIYSMRKLFVFFFLLSFFYSANTYGQKVELSDVWVEQNVMKDGKQGMTVHCDVHISGMKGRKFKGVAFFYNANKNKLMGGKGSYSTKSGHVCAHSFGTPRYDKSHYSDFSIFIPYSSFPYASGNHKYYVIVDYYDVNKGEYITNNTKYVAFNINRQRKQQTTDNTYQVDNLKSKTIVEKKVCFSCGGDGVCRICMGQGGRYDRRNYLWLKCTACLGSIKCPTCNGTGYTTLTMVINPDGSGYGYDNNGHVVATEGGGGGTFNPTPKPVIEHDRTPLYRDCKYCTGTGRCSRCNGKGTSFVTGEFGNQLCPRCNGSGKCDICRGRGKL